MKELYPMRGVITTVNTPFNEDLTINWSDLRRTAEAALEAGVSGFLAPCFASEIDELTNEERYRMVTELLAVTHQAGHGIVMPNVRGKTKDDCVEQAKRYLGTEYRWGGKSGRGIDCSGLVSSAYMQCGVLIYRDARLVEGWPMHEVAFEEKKPGDALFFPGHVALYLGEGRYIHSTGAAASGGVVINSLEPGDPLYRDDLVKSLYAVGSVF